MSSGLRRLPLALPLWLSTLLLPCWTESAAEEEEEEEGEEGEGWFDVGFAMRLFLGGEEFGLDIAV